MDVNKNFREVARARRAQRKERIKADLIKSIETKFKTVFIGAISAFEEFDDLWGARRPEAELTDEEFEFRLAWEDVRNRVLTNGNNQLRHAITEIMKGFEDYERNN